MLCSPNKLIKKKKIEHSTIDSDTLQSMQNCKNKPTEQKLPNQIYNLHSPLSFQITVQIFLLAEKNFPSLVSFRLITYMLHILLFQEYPALSFLTLFLFHVQICPGSGEFLPFLLRQKKFPNQKLFFTKKNMVVQCLFMHGVKVFPSKSSQLTMFV